MISMVHKDSFLKPQEGYAEGQEKSTFRCLGSNQFLKRTKRVTPHGRPDAARGVQPGLRGLDGETLSCAGLCGGRTRARIYFAVWAQRKPMKALRVSGGSLEVRLPDKR